MNFDVLFVFSLLAVTIALFVSNRLRLDMVALLVILALALSGILTPAEAVAGFGSNLVILIAGLFVVGEGLFRTGIAFAIGDWMSRLGGTTEIRLLVMLMLAVAALSALMSSTGAVAIFIPVALHLAAQAEIPPARLLLPMAYASLIGGMLTLIGTPPNLAVSTHLTQAGLEPFHFFSFTPIGLLVLLVGLGYIVAIRHYLPSGNPDNAHRERRVSVKDLIHTYHLEGRFHLLKVLPKSSLVGKTVAQAKVRTRHRVVVMSFDNGRRIPLEPAMAQSRYRANGLVYVIGDEDKIRRFARAEQLQILGTGADQLQQTGRDLGLVEVLPTPRSPVIGRTLRQANFRQNYGLNAVGMLRQGRPLSDQELAEIRFEVGDSLLMGGSWKQIRRLQNYQRDFVVLTLPREIDEVAPNKHRYRHALVILLAMLLVLGFDLLPSVTAVVGAAVAMVLSGCLTMNRAYEAINWQAVVLIAGMLPLATALEKTGAADLIVNTLTANLGEAHPSLLLVAFFVLTSLFSQFISNTATAVLVAPIALATAETLGLSPYPLLMTVAIAASTAFATPIASPVNTLVLGPGGYCFNDFVRIGVPLQVLSLIVTLVAVPLLFPW